MFTFISTKTKTLLLTSPSNLLTISSSIWACDTVCGGPDSTDEPSPLPKNPASNINGEELSSLMFRSRGSSDELAQ